MRLIDADALHSNFFDYSPREMVWDRGDVEHKINEMPTIDAIPVEWLRDILQQAVDSGGRYRDVANGLGLVLAMWEEKQEAQDG